MTIEERWPCPTCANPRTLRLGERRLLCLNCRTCWRQPDAALGTNPAAALFDVAELKRMQLYRYAVQAGYYTDDLPVRPDWR